MSKTTRMFGKGIATMFFLFIASNNVWAGDTYYRDCDVKVNSPSTAQGLVYVDVDTDRPSRAYKFHSSAPGQSAQVKANFKSVLVDYDCRLLAYPKPGYAVAGFVTKEDYLAGRKTNQVVVVLQLPKAMKVKSQKKIQQVAVHIVFLRSQQQNFMQYLSLPQVQLLRFQHPEALNTHFHKQEKVKTLVILW